MFMKTSYIIFVNIVANGKINCNDQCMVLHLCTFLCQYNTDKAETKYACICSSDCHALPNYTPTKRMLFIPRQN